MNGSLKSVIYARFPENPFQFGGNWKGLDRFRRGKRVLVTDLREILSNLEKIGKNWRPDHGARNGPVTALASAGR